MHFYDTTVAVAINIFISHIAVGLDYIVFDFKCRYETSSFSILVGISLDECVKQCSLRQGCASIIFKRLYPVCELYDVDVSTSSPVRTSCIVVRKNDVTLNGSEVNNYPLAY